MKHVDGRLKGEAGVSIYYQIWLPAAKPKAAVVVVHGLGEHSGRYRHVAEALLALDCAVYAIDHRGHGKSTGARAYVDRFSNLTKDLDQLVNKARQEQRGKPVFLLGHSLGGATSLSYAIQHQGKLDALILSGPAVALDGAPPLIKPISRLLSLIAPKLGTFPIDPKLVSRDPAMVEAYSHDPLNCKGKVPARTLGEIVRVTDVLPAMVPVLKLPLLVMHGGDDKLAGPSGGEMVVKRASSKDKTFKRYEGLYHEIFNELPEDRARVLSDLKNWIAERL